MGLHHPFKKTFYIHTKYVCFQKNTREPWGNTWVVGYNCLRNQVYIYISQQSMFWRNSWVLGIPTSHILTACKPIYIRCWFRVVAKIYISTRDVSPKNEGTIGLWGTPALYLPHSNRLQNHVCFPKITTVLKEHMASHILTVCNTNYVSKKNYFIFNGMRGFVHISPEKSIHMYVCICCGKLPFLWWLGGSRIYIYMCVCFCLEKIYPWRHSNCWLPNSFILGGGAF